MERIATRSAHAQAARCELRRGTSKPCKCSNSQRKLQASAEHNTRSGEANRGQNRRKEEKAQVLPRSTMSSSPKVTGQHQHDSLMRV